MLENNNQVTINVSNNSLPRCCRFVYIPVREGEGMLCLRAGRVGRPASPVEGRAH